MKLNLQKKLAALVAGVSPKRIRIDTSDRLDDIKESITKADIRGLIKDKVIKVKQKKGVSRARANKIMRQKSKGKRKGPGSLKGSPNSRTPRKKLWIRKVRIQRRLLNELKEKGIIDTKVYRLLYMKSKGGYFRSKRHLKLYIREQNLAKNVEKQ